MAGKSQQRGLSVVAQRAERSRAKLNAGLAVETDPRRRLSLALDYLRAALAVPPDSQPDNQTAERAVVALITAADRIYSRKGKTK